MNTGSRKYPYRDELEGIMAEGEIFHTYSFQSVFPPGGLSLTCSHARRRYGPLRDDDGGGDHNNRHYLSDLRSNRT